jgi:hypothetical protein
MISPSPVTTSVDTELETFVIGVAVNLIVPIAAMMRGILKRKPVRAVFAVKPAPNTSLLNITKIEFIG